MGKNFNLTCGEAYRILKALDEGRQIQFFADGGWSRSMITMDWELGVLFELKYRPKPEAVYRMLKPTPSEWSQNEGSEVEFSDCADFSREVHVGTIEGLVSFDNSFPWVGSDHNQYKYARVRVDG